MIFLFESDKILMQINILWRALFMADPDASCCKKKDIELISLESISNMERLEGVLKSDELLNEQCVSLYDVFLLTQQFYCEYKAYERKMRKLINDKLKNINEGFYVILHDMDYSTYIAHLVVVKKQNVLCEYEEIFFAKDEMGIYIDELKGKNFFDEQILTIIGGEMLELYDYQLMCENKKSQNSCSVKTLNSEFYSNISRSYVEIYLEIDGIKRFDINLYTYSDKVKCKCGSSKLMQLLKREYKKFYSNIFVKIEDCPEWMHGSLIKIREEQVQKREKEKKKRKRREALRKFFKI